MYHFLINPASRSGKGQVIWDTLIEPELIKEKLSYEAHFSQKAGDFVSMAKELTANTGSPVTLVILGGDGTFNEVLQGIESLDQVRIGYIPTGSSNDLARDLGISKDPVKALHKMLSVNQSTDLDLGQVSLPDGTKRLFAVSCGIGYDAAVCAGSLNPPLKRFLNKIGLGKLTYLGVALKQLCKAPLAEATIIPDDQEPIRISHFLFNASMLHRYEGGGFMFCPEADATDGILDLCCVGKLSKFTIIRALPSAYSGKHFRYNGIDAYRAAKVKIATSEPMWVHTDGEVLGEWNNVTIRCLPGALHMLL